MQEPTPEPTEPQTPQDYERQRRQEQQKESHDILVENTQIMFDNVAKYLQAELQATSGDYKLLQQMNAVTRDKYVEMTRMTSVLVGSMTDLQQKYQNFQPYLAKIDEIDASVAELERTVMLLDDYTKRLELKFQQLRQANQPGPGR